MLSIDTHDNVCRAICKGAGCIVVGVNYCKSPENKFPKPTRGRLGLALSGPTENAAEIGGDPARIAVGGDSAGGCLAAVTAQRAKAGGRAARWSFSSWSTPSPTPTRARESYRTFADGYVLNAEAMTWFFDCYFNDDSERADVRAAPHPRRRPERPAAGDGDDREPRSRCSTTAASYAEKLAAAGVPTDYRNYEGHIHGFWTATGQLRRERPKPTRPPAPPCARLSAPRS